MDAAISYALKTNTRKAATRYGIPLETLRTEVQRHRSAQMPQWPRIMALFAQLRHSIGTQPAIDRIKTDLPPRYHKQFENRARIYKPTLSKALQDLLDAQIYKVRKEAQQLLSSQMSPSLYVAIERWSKDEEVLLTQMAHHAAHQFT